MIGTYRFIQDGKVIAESSNLITTAGRKALLDYAARFTKQLVGSLVVGIGSTAAAVGDKKLAFEVSRSTIQNNSVDYPNNAVVFKAQIPQDVAMTIYEVGAHTLESTQNTEYSSALLFDFNQTFDTWSGGTFVATNSRLGSALQMTSPVSTATTYTLANIYLDLSGFSSADTFTLAYRANNAFVSSVSFRFVTSAGNYYATSIAAPSSGTYTLASVLKSAFTTTGAPDWANITQVDIVVTSTAGGIGSIDFDGVRVDDLDANREESVLFSRSVLGTPVVKTADLPLDIEYAVTF
jgi:hypothetical protein